MIADLNAYYTFVSSLKVRRPRYGLILILIYGRYRASSPSSRKDAGPRLRRGGREGPRADRARRDALRRRVQAGGVSSRRRIKPALCADAEPQDVYEFIQRRSDWKKIEKTVDKTMYNLSFKDDCVVC